MNYEEFLACVQQKVAEIVGKEGKVSVSHVFKNNGVELDGLIIMMNGSNISPTIYLNNYFEEYGLGKPVEEIIDMIMEVFEENKDKLSICADYFMNFENIKDRIVYKLINYEQNKKLLENVPYKKMLDLAVVFYCLLEQGASGNATALIYNNHMMTWNVDEEEIYEKALENTPRLLKSEIRRMEDIIRELFMQDNDISEDECRAMMEEIDVERQADMYVLTNSSKINGAACILYEDVLSEFADKINSDLFILPSSIHEVIIVPKAGGLEKSQLCDMVSEVNSDGVAHDEVLSDNVYIYNRGDNFISL